MGGLIRIQETHLNKLFKAMAILGLIGLIITLIHVADTNSYTAAVARDNWDGSGGIVHNNLGMPSLIITIIGIVGMLFTKNKRQED